MFNYPNYPEPYRIKNNCLYYCGPNRDGYSEQLLCNFVLQVVCEIIFDDGVQTISHVTINGIHHSGRELEAVELPSSEALSLSWVQDRWGMDCILEPSTNTAARVRKALQCTADSSERQYVYGITGWKKIKGVWEFLMPGDENLTVRLSEKMRGYKMERSFTRADLDMAAQFLVYPPASTEVIFPLLALTFLSPLNHFLREAGCEPKFAMLLQGRTGSRKSTLAALMLSFFGKFNASELPMSFRDTKYSIIKKAFALKDVLTCIDDFHPTGRQEEAKMKETAQSILRSYGDRTGRARLRQDTSLMESQPPQGNAIITAEMPPDVGESGTARYFCVEIKESDVNLDKLSELQRAAASAVLQRCMYAYIQWLKDSYLSTPEDEEKFVEALKELFTHHRDTFRGSGTPCHGRVPEMVACLKIGMDLLLLFLMNSGCLSESDALELKERFSVMLLFLARWQASNILQDKPTHKFIRKLYALLDAQQVTLLPKNGSHDWIPNSNVGYEDDTFLYLHSEVAYRQVRKFCEEQGEDFSLSYKALLKALAEECFIETCGTQNTKSVRIDNKSKRLLCLYKEKAQQVLEES